MLNNAKKLSKLILVLSFILILSSIALCETPKWFLEVVTKRRANVKEKTTEEFVNDLWNTISDISEKYNMDPVFISTVIALESNFTNAKGPGGVLGMMQILPSTAQGIAKLLKLEVPKDGWNTLLTDYKLKITYGTAYLSYLYKKTGSLSKALEEYNNGKNKQKYATTVMQQYEYYKSLHEKELKEKAQININTFIETSESSSTQETTQETQETTQETQTTNSTINENSTDTSTTKSEN
ncbi:MAG TPA: transglycosylase SLT domain-containing protein [Fervidobacterium nodosum]|nr:transglycosylase SLT domain-containing protein [Fervidobacterium nodosum]